jgi:hypothetical protein
MQDHIAHIITHIDYAKDPMYGSNPIMAPVFMPALLEHLKQHLTLWYLNQVDGYTSAALNRPFNVLKVEPIMREAQKLVAAAAKHVHADSQQIAAEIAPAIQQALQLVQQSRGQQPMPPEIQALVQTQMAETQRKASYDQNDLQLRAQKQAADASKDAAKMKLELVMNTEDNLTEERIKSAELTNDAARLQHEQVQTAIEAQNAIQSNLGGQNV